MLLPGDVRLSLRSLLKNPGFTFAAVAMLALGIGINATVFTVTQARCCSRAFRRNQEQRPLLYISNGGCCISYPDFEDIRAQANSFEGMGITHGISAALTDGSGFAERLDITEISADTFPDRRCPTDPGPPVYARRSEPRRPGRRTAEPWILAAPLRQGPRRRRSHRCD